MSKTFNNNAQDKIVWTFFSTNFCLHVIIAVNNHKNSFLNKKKIINKTNHKKEEEKIYLKRAIFVLCMRVHKFEYDVLHSGRQ